MPQQCNHVEWNPFVAAAGPSTALLTSPGAVPITAAAVHPAPGVGAIAAAAVAAATQSLPPAVTPAPRGPTSTAANLFSPPRCTPSEWSDVPALSWSSWRRCANGMGVVTSAVAPGEATPDNLQALLGLDNSCSTAHLVDQFELEGEVGQASPPRATAFGVHADSSMTDDFASPAGTNVATGGLLG